MGVDQNASERRRDGISGGWATGFHHRVLGGQPHGGIPKVGAMNAVSPVFGSAFTASDAKVVPGNTNAVSTC
jgi:hypothetical protein